MPDHLRKSGFPKMSPDDMLAISPSVGNPGDAFGEKKKGGSMWLRKGEKHEMGTVPGLVLSSGTSKVCMLSLLTFPATGGAGARIPSL